MEPVIYWGYVPTRVKRQLKYHMDIPVSGNWEAFAENLNVPSEEITWIKYSHCDSFMDKLMENLQNRVSIAQIQEALKAIGNEAALTILNDAYPDILHTYNESKLQRCKQSLRDMPFKRDDSWERRDRPRQAVVRPPPSILLTHSSKVRSEFLAVGEWLRKNSFDAGFITREDTFSNMSQYVTKCFQQARFIMVLVTEDYLNEVEIESSSEDSSSSVSVSANVTRYIHQLMGMEFFKNCCSNSRFIPVLIGVADSSRRRLPVHLSNTRVYEWPKHYQELHRFIEQHISPRNQ